MVHQVQSEMGGGGGPAQAVFFSNLKQDKIKSQIPPLKDEEGKMTESEEELTRLVEDHFEKFLSGMPVPAD